MQRTLFPGLAATEWVSCMSWPKASKPRHEWTVSLQCLISRDQEYRKRSFCVHCWSSLVHCVEQTQNGLYLQWMQLKFCCILRFSSRSKKIFRIHCDFQHMSKHLPFLWNPPRITVFLPSFFSGPSTQQRESHPGSMDSPWTYGTTAGIDSMISLGLFTWRPGKISKPRSLHQQKNELPIILFQGLVDSYEIPINHNLRTIGDLKGCFSGKMVSSDHSESV